MLLALLVAAAEALAFIALSMIEGGPSWRSSLRAERREILDQGSWATPLGIDVPNELTKEVLHPYLGFVFDPALNERENRRARGELEITEHGFFRPPGPPPHRSGNEFRVGVFGGSAAFIFAIAAQEVLVEELERVPELARRGVVVDSFGMAGFKQPQQLMTLAYLLSLGERFDAVVNLDGFNEVALTLTENVPQGVYPFYPRAWPQRVAGPAAPGVERLQESLEDRISRRRALAARFVDSGVARRSALASLAWRAADRSLAAGIADLQKRLLLAVGEDSGYEGHGPPGEDTEPGELYARIAQVWAGSSLLMHQLCRANGIFYHHLLQPNQYVPGSKPMGHEEKALAYDEDSQYRVPVVDGYPFLVAAGRGLVERGVDFHDMSGAFADVERPLYFDSCCHFDEHGSAILARLVAREIRAQLPGR